MDVARQGQQLLHRDEVAALVARSLGGLLQVELVVTRDDANEISDLVAFQHQGLEHLVDVLAQLVGDVLRPEVVLVHLVRNQLIRNLLLVKDAAGVGFIDFFFGHDYFLCSSTQIRAFTNASIQGETSSFLRSSG